MKPKRMIGGSPVFALSGGEFMLTDHAIYRAKSRGMTCTELLDVLDMPEKVVAPTARSQYYGEPVLRYVKGKWAVVVDYAAPVMVVVTVLFTDEASWAAWNEKQVTS